MFCRECGFKVHNEDRFCANCGKETGQDKISKIVYNNENDNFTQMAQKSYLNNNILNKKIVTSFIYIVILLSLCFITPNYSFSGGWKDEGGYPTVLIDYKGYYEIYDYGTKLNYSGGYLERSIFTLSPFDYILIIIGLIGLYIILKYYFTPCGIDWNKLFKKLNLNKKYLFKK